jgi:hypothetical protein
MVMIGASAPEPDMLPPGPFRVLSLVPRALNPLDAPLFINTHLQKNPSEQQSAVLPVS